MTHDEANAEAARRLLAESLPPFSIVEARYAPAGRAPAWAEPLIGARTQWLVNGDTEHMTPYPLPMTLDGPARCVPIEHLCAVERVGSMLDEN